MVQKKAIIEKLNAIDAQETPEEDAGNAIRELMKEWNGIGHVPFKEKDKLYKQYHGVIDKLFDKLNLSASQKKLSILNQPSARKATFIVNAKNWFVLTKT